MPLRGISGPRVCIYTILVMPDSFLKWLYHFTFLPVVYKNFSFSQGCQYLVGNRIVEMYFKIYFKIPGWIDEECVERSRWETLPETVKRRKPWMKSSGESELKEAPTSRGVPEKEEKKNGTIRPS